jgi:hypothetical protein
MIVALASALGNVTGDLTVSVTLDWAVTFDGPDLESGGDEEEVQADEAFASYFTDSSSDWASGTKLTLKHREGGAPVPFPGLVPDVIYKLQTHAKLAYYKRNEEDPNSVTLVKAYITHGVRVRNYNTAPILAVFASESTARAYVRYGDDAYCLDFHQAGDFVVPPNPPWFPTGHLTALKSLGPARPTGTTAEARVARLESLLAQAMERLAVLEEEEGSSDETPEEELEREREQRRPQQGEA